MDVSGVYAFGENHDYSYTNGLRRCRGNDTSYDEQAPPELPPSLQRELRKHGLEENYRPSNWGGPGGDWCRQVFRSNASLKLLVFTLCTI